MLKRKSNTAAVLIQEAKPLTEGTDAWEYLEKTRGIPQSTIRNAASHGALKSHQGGLLAISSLEHGRERTQLIRLRGIEKAGHPTTNGTGGHVRLTWGDAAHCLVAEGVETALSLHSCHPENPTFATLGSLANFTPPDGCAKVTVSVDRDAAGANGAVKLHDRLVKQGIECVLLLPPDGFADANDSVRAGMGAGATVAAADLRREFGIEEAKEAPPKQLAESFDGSHHAKRRVEEIANAPEGKRWETMRRHAYTAGGYGQPLAELLEAGRRNMPDDKRRAEKVIRSAYMEGAKNPLASDHPRPAIPFEVLEGGLDAPPDKTPLTKEQREMLDLINLNADEFTIRRVVRFSPHRFRRGKSGKSQVSYVCDRFGLWSRLDVRAKTAQQAVIAEIIESSNAKALVEAEPLKLDKRTIDIYTAAKDVMGRNIQKGEAPRWAKFCDSHLSGGHPEFDGVGVVSEPDFNNLTRNPVIPLSGGGAWHLAEYRFVDADELAPMLMLENGWNIPRPEPPKDDGTPEVACAIKHWGPGGRFHPLLKRVASMMFGPRKVVDSVCADPNIGKSVAFEFLANALPGAVMVTSANEAFMGKDKFLPIHSNLTSHICVGLDEADKIPYSKMTNVAIHAMQLNPLCANLIPVHEKYERPGVERRIGTAVIISNPWPRIEATSPGVTERMGGWSLHIDGSLTPKLTEDEYHLLESDRAAKWLRDSLFAEAKRQHDEGEVWALDEDRERDAKTMFARALPDEIQELRLIYAAQEGGEVDAKEVADELKRILGKEPGPTVRSRLMRDAFGPDVKSTRSTAIDIDTGQRGRIWRGIVRIGSAEHSNPALNIDTEF